MSTATARHCLTLVMGCFIPVASLALSFIAGHYATHGTQASIILAIACFAIVGCVLAVSLSHLAWAIGDITKSPGWASWLLAIAFDLTLCVGECGQVFASDAGIAGIVYTLMGCVCVLSMLLNCWAFLGHPKAEARAVAKKARQNGPATTSKPRSRKVAAPKIAAI